MGTDTDPEQRQDRRVWMQHFGLVTLINASEGASAQFMPVEQKPVAVETVPGAFITKLEMSERKSKATFDEPAIRSGAIYDRHGHALKEFGSNGAVASKVVRRFDQAILCMERREKAESLSGSYAYGGELKRHFGHFLLETLSRAWAFSDKHLTTSRAIYHSDYRKLDLDRTKSFILQAAGVDINDIVLADRDLKVSSLEVPNAQFDIVTKASPGFMRVFNRVSETALSIATVSKEKRVYFTRRLVNAAVPEKAKRHTSEKAARVIRKAILNETDVENLFKARGFKIVSPELLAIEQQIALVHGADVIAGITGTALHLALFSRNPGLTVISLDTRIPRNQIAIEQISGLRGFHIFCGTRAQHSDPLKINLQVLERGLVEIETKQRL